MKKVIILSLLLFFGFVTGSYATLIDFTSDDFSLAYGESSFYNSPTGLTIEALPDGATLYQDDTDGIGVQRDYEYDEIEEMELLHLHFDNAQLLNEILITDLFNEPYNYGEGSFLEQGQYSFDNSSWVSFEADEDQTPSPDTNGELTLSFPSSTVITDVWFQAPGWQTWDDTYGGWLEDHEFSVGGIDVSPVPEPSTMLLVVSGLIDLAGLRKRFRRKYIRGG